ncbi:hypothetical protein N7U66_17720 [Lacinutrix neustonica]|uniref:Uncharacterized protein n=1 Tax=Lacinutrix neustonica TaxID=2980107 RepID=A0A9E8MUH7_9FLAO|nr:hypothetical protein [Lacinutrix neustonica]WAC01718.1 hypothetical protein N7U66_17720 [Lacinutrix neustonica]
MTPAVGYAVRAPQTFSTNTSTKTVYTARYEGVPNNGAITIPITVGTDANVGTSIGDTAVTADDDQWNLIGNPYPSAIDVMSFLNEANNSTLLDGTVYIWTHNTPPNSAYPDPFYADYGANYTSSDYASINALGSTNTAATGGAAPTQYIASVKPSLY